MGMGPIVCVVMGVVVHALSASASGITGVDISDGGARVLAETLTDSGYSAYRTSLFSLLDVPVSASALEIHKQISECLPATRLMQLSEDDVVAPVERDLVIPLRTLKTRIERDLPLTIEESDRLFRIAHVHALADAVFGEPAKAIRWLSKSKERFGGLAPMHLLTTQHGANIVVDMLLRISLGLAF